MTDRPCPDCAVEVGQPHQDGCDVAICLATGFQRIGCDGGEVDEDDMDESWDDEDRAAFLAYADPHDCGEDVWSGEFPGVADCRRLGLMHRYVRHDTGEPVTDPREQMRLVRTRDAYEAPCGVDAPGAEPDLNRLNPMGGCVWDAGAKRWELA